MFSTGSGGIGVLDHLSGVILGEVRGELATAEFRGCHVKEVRAGSDEDSLREPSRKSPGAAGEVFAVGGDFEEYE